MLERAPFIIVTGNIATGKSTLIEALGVELGLPVHQELVEKNPFFAPPPRYSLETEVWFLADAVRTHRAIQRGGRGGIQERSAYEQLAVFACARARMGWLNSDELGLLEMLSEQLCEGLHQPGLLIYLEADIPAVRERIARRARPSELELTTEYLSTLRDLYDVFVDGWTISPVYRVDTTLKDIREESDFRLACSEIREILS